MKLLINGISQEKLLELAALAESRSTNLSLYSLFLPLTAEKWMRKAV